MRSISQSDEVATDSRPGWTLPRAMDRARTFVGRSDQPKPVRPTNGVPTGRRRSPAQVKTVRSRPLWWPAATWDSCPRATAFETRWAPPQKSPVLILRNRILIPGIPGHATSLTIGAALSTGPCDRHSTQVVFGSEPLPHPAAQRITNPQQTVVRSRLATGAAPMPRRPQKGESLQTDLGIQEPDVRSCSTITARDNM